MEGPATAAKLGNTNRRLVRVVAATARPESTGRDQLEPSVTAEATTTSSRAGHRAWIARLGATRALELRRASAVHRGGTPTSLDWALVKHALLVSTAQQHTRPRPQRAAIVELVSMLLHLAPPLALSHQRADTLRPRAAQHQPPFAQPGGTGVPPGSAPALAVDSVPLDTTVMCLARPPTSRPRRNAPQVDTVPPVWPAPTARAHALQGTTARWGQLTLLCRHAGGRDSTVQGETRLLYLSSRGSTRLPQAHLQPSGQEKSSALLGLTASMAPSTTVRVGILGPLMA